MAFLVVGSPEADSESGSAAGIEVQTHERNSVGK